MKKPIDLKNYMQIEQLGTLIHQSGMFIAENEAEGFMIALLYFQENRSLSDFLKQNLTSGKSPKPAR